MFFRLMTWNVENLYRPASDSSKARLTAYRRKLELIAETVTALRTDVLALQEVGSADAIADLQKQLRGEYRASAISEHPDQRGIRVAFISRLPIESKQDIWRVAPTGIRAFRADTHDADATASMRRGALRVTVTVGDHRVSVIAAHLKSKLLSYPTPEGGTAFHTNDEQLRARIACSALAERSVEAVTLRNAVSQLLQEHPRDRLMLVGDLNDVAEAATTQILYGPGGSQPGTRAFDQRDDGDPARLFNLAAFIDPDRRYSRVTAGVPELIDHILVSANTMPEGSGNQRVAPRVDAHVDVAGTGRLPSVGDDPHARDYESVPDHAPISAEFDTSAWNPARPIERVRA